MNFYCCNYFLISIFDSSLVSDGLYEKNRYINVRHQEL